MSTAGTLNTRSKIVSRGEAGEVAARLRAAGKRIVFTNGCFDILHPGHVVYLENARNLGDALIVALNSDVSVRALKGVKRPILPEGDRALLLAALQCVDCVTLFDEVRATGVIEVVRPDVYVKGGDYTIETLNPEEREALQACGAEIGILPLIEGFSTTDIIARILSIENHGSS